jgi:hypothetical protein
MFVVNAVPRKLLVGRRLNKIFVVSNTYKKKKKKKESIRLTIIIPGEKCAKAHSKI